MSFGGVLSPEYLVVLKRCQKLVALLGTFEALVPDLADKHILRAAREALEAFQASLADS